MKILLEISFFVCLNLFLFGYLHRKLMLQNISMRQQLAIYKRKKIKPKMKERDRLFWVFLSKLWPDWKSTLIIVQPETVIRVLTKITFHSGLPLQQYTSLLVAYIAMGMRAPHASSIVTIAPPYCEVIFIRALNIGSFFQH